MEKNTVVFIPDSSQIADLFEKHMKDVCDYPFQSFQGNFYFRVPASMDIDELTEVLEALLKHQDDIKGDWTAVECDSPESILMDFENVSADMEQFGVYFIPGQISRHEEFSNSEDDLQPMQVQREENMTLRLIHSLPEAVSLLRKTIQAGVPNKLYEDIVQFFSDANLPLEE